MKFFKNYCAIIALALLCPFSNYAQAPPLGTAYNFAVFTSAGDFHNDGISTITGDIGTNAGVLDGFPPGIVIGDIQIINPATVQASIDLGLAYADLATRTCDNVIGVTLGNDQILTPGVYCTGAASTLNGNLTLDGEDDENAIFIFQVNGAFATTVNSTITLINGAKACNIYWQINGAFALLDNSVFKGNALINGAISLHTNSNLEGRALTTAGAVSTESVTVCAHATPPVITCPASLVFACAADVPDPDTDGVTAIELCGGDEANVIFVSDVILNGDCANQFSIARTYNASDICGNNASCLQYIYVNDSIAPVIACPSGITIGCIGDLPAPNTAAVASSDACGGEVVIAFTADSTGTITDPNNYNIYRKYSSTDACGNVSYCTQIINVNGSGTLTISCPDDQNVACSGDVTPADIGDVSASAGCGGNVTITFAPDVISAQTCPDNYTITRTYTATDAAGNTVICSQTIVVDDNIAPVITCPADVTVGCAGDIPDADPASIETGDNCEGLVTVTVDADVITDFIDADNFSILRNYHATDVCGNTSECTQTIIVSNEVTFGITCPESASFSCALEVPAADIESVTVSVACGATYTVTSAPDVITTGSCANDFVITRTYTATDGNGNNVSCSQTITVSDDIAPEITCPDDITVGCATLIPDADINTVSATDNCGGIVTITAGADDVTDYEDENHFTILRTYQATDECGNISTCIQYIVVSGDGEFTISCPADLSVDCASEVPAPDNNAVTINGNCGEGITVTVAADVISNVTCTNNYTITRTYTATDESGVSVSCDQTIIVADDIAPMIICPATVNVSCAQNVPLANINSVSTTDNCGTAVIITVAPDVIINQVCANRYQINRTYTATDVCGNSSNCTQIINVFDNEGPVISIPPVIANITCGETLPLQAILSATDNCGSASITSSVDPYEVNTCEGYAITYRWTATDVCGNTSVLTRTFQVSPDTQAPVITAVNPDLINGTLTIDCQNSNPDWNPFPFTSEDVTAEDACNNAYVTYSRQLLATGECGVDDFISKWLLTWTATDDCGNAGVYTVTLNIVDVTPPVFTVLPPSEINADCTNVPAADMLTATDECGDAFVTMNEDVIQGDCPGSYDIIRKYKASTGDCDYKNYFTQIIHVTDNSAPVINFNNLPGDNYVSGDTFEIDCDYLSAMQLDVSNVSVTDTCSAASVIFDMTYNYAANCAVSGYLYNVQAVWTAVDECGNVGKFYLNFKVSDHTPPVFSNIPANICVTQLSSIPANIIASDNCGSVKITFSESLPVSCGQNNSLVKRTWTATDDCGNVARDSQIIIINSNPVNLSFSVNMPGFENMPDSSIIYLESTIDEQYGIQNITSENILIENGCLNENTISVNTDLLDTGSCVSDGYLYKVEVEIIVTDLCGNTGRLTYFVTVIDQTPPVIYADAAVTAKCGAILPLPKVTDNSNQPLSVTFEDETPLTFNCINDAPVQRIWTVTDSCGNVSTFTQSITYVDDEGPVLTGIPSDDCGNNSEIYNVTAHDECSDLDFPVTFSETTYNSDCGTVILRTWTATDNCGNVSIDSQKIFNTDLIAPVITITAPELIKLNSGDTFELACDVDKIPDMLAYYGLSSVTAKDNCGGNIVMDFDTKFLENANCKTQGYFAKYQYTWTATDPCGNQSKLILIGKFTDKTAPVFDTIPADLILYCNDELPSFEAINASDCYLDNVTKQQILMQNDGINVIYNRIWTATDLCGNSSEATQVITIKGSDLSCAINIPEFPVNCGSLNNIITSTITGGQGPFMYEWELVNCDGYISGGQGTDAITVVNGYTTMNIVLTVTDEMGCISICNVSLECTEEGQGAGDLIYGNKYIETKAVDMDEEPVQMQLYPNPATDHVVITAHGYSGQKVKLEVIDILGNIKHTMEIEEMPYAGIKVDFRELAEGIYLINLLKSGREPLMKKVMVGHR